MLKRGLASIKIILVLISIICLVLSLSPIKVFAGDGGGGDSGGGESTADRLRRENQERLDQTRNRFNAYNSEPGGCMDCYYAEKQRQEEEAAREKEREAEQARVRAEQARKREEEAQRRLAEARAAEAQRKIDALKARIIDRQAKYKTTVQTAVNKLHDLNRRIELGKEDPEKLQAEKEKIMHETSGAIDDLGEMYSEQVKNDFERIQKDMEAQWTSAQEAFEKAKQEREKAEADIARARGDVMTEEKFKELYDTFIDKRNKWEAETLRQKQAEATHGYALDNLRDAERKLDKTSEMARKWEKLAEMQYVVQKVHDEGKPVADFENKIKELGFDSYQELSIARGNLRDEMEKEGEPIYEGKPEGMYYDEWWADKAKEAKDAEKEAMDKHWEAEQALEEADATLEKANVNLEKAEEDIKVADAALPKDHVMPYETAPVVPPILEETTIATIRGEPEYVGGGIIERTSQEGSCDATYAGGTRCGYGNTITIQARYKNLQEGTYYPSIVLSGEGCRVTYNVGDGTSTEKEKWRRKDQVNLFIGGSIDHRIYEIDWRVQSGDILNECFGKTVNVDSIKLYRDASHTQFIV